MAATFYTNDVLTYNDASAGNVGALSFVDTTQHWPLGQYREEGGNGFLYVQYDASDVSITVGSLAYYEPVSGKFAYKVTQDVSDSHVNLAAGVFMGALTATSTANFGWIQVTGSSPVATVGGGNIVLGDNVIGSGDGTVTRMIAGTASTNTIIGVAVASEAASVVQVRLLLK